MLAYPEFNALFEIHTDDSKLRIGAFVSQKGKPITFYPQKMNSSLAVTQQVLLFGAESWVLTGKMEAALDTFQGRVARRLTGRTPRRGRDGKWTYLPLAGAFKDAGIVRVKTSVLRRQNTVAQFVATRPILDLCEDTERQGGGHGSPKDGGSRRE